MSKIELNFNNKKFYRKICLLISALILLISCKKNSNNNNFQNQSERDKEISGVAITLNIAKTNFNENYNKQEILYYNSEKGFVTATNEQNEFTMGGVQGTESLIQIFEGIPITFTQETEFPENIDSTKINFMAVNSSVNNTFCNSIELYIKDDKIKIKNNIVNRLPTLTECEFKPTSKTYKIQNQGVIQLTFNYTVKDWQSSLGDGTEAQKTAKEIEINDNLTELRLDGKNITDLSPIISLVELITLSLENNNISTLPKQIKNLNNLESILLANNKLEEFPDSILQFQELVELNLSDNKISEIPKEIEKLSKIDKLKLDYNNISTLTEEVGYLLTLTELSLENNKITEIPSSVENLLNLKILNLQGNKISTIPTEIENLTELNKLLLRNNQISAIPNEIKNLNNLNVFTIEKNSLSELPIVIFELPNLTEINFSQNKITSIPSEIVNLKQLKTLRINNNSLTELPSNVCQLENLTVLDLRYNSISTISDNIANLKNLKQIFLSNNKITTLPNSIKTLSKINTFYIQDNNIENIEKDVFNWIVNIGTYDLSPNPGYPLFGNADSPIYSKSLKLRMKPKKVN